MSVSSFRTLCQFVSVADDVKGIDLNHMRLHSELLLSSLLPSFTFLLSSFPLHSSRPHASPPAGGLQWFCSRRLRTSRSRWDAGGLAAGAAIRPRPTHICVCGGEKNGTFGGGGGGGVGIISSSSSSSSPIQSLCGGGLEEEEEEEGKKGREREREGKEWE